MFQPSTMKDHNLIVKTASFISSNGAQMEIVIKAKQSRNRSFDFLDFDSTLNPYYRFVLSVIKSGKFVPDAPEEVSENSDESDSDDGNYLHPSLLGGGKTATALPLFPRSTNETETAYSQLVQSLKGKIAVSSSDEDTPSTIETNGRINPIEKTALTPNSYSNGASILPTPPPEVEQIIDKLAQHVAKNGDEFEISIKRRGDQRFDFLNPGNCYHAHYIRRKLHHLEEKRETHIASSKAAEKERKPSAQANVSFSIGSSSKERKHISTKDVFDEASSEVHKKSIKSRDPEPTTKTSDSALTAKLATAAKDELNKEKQMERKRRAALFLSMLKSKVKIEEGSSTNAPSESDPTFGPSLPSITIPATLKTSKSSSSLPKSGGGNLLPFTSKDEPIKETSHHSHRHKHDRHKHKSQKKKRSRSRSRERSKERSSHKKHRRRSRSRSRN